MNASLAPRSTIRSHDRTRRWLEHISALGFAITYAITSWGKLHDPGHFDRFGYPRWLALLAGALEAIGAVCWVVPRTRFLATVLIVPVMLGAIATHVRRAELAMATVPAVLAAAQLAHARWVRRRSTTP